MLKLLKTIDQVKKECTEPLTESSIAPIISKFGTCIEVLPFDAFGVTHYNDRIGYIYNPKWFK